MTAKTIIKKLIPPIILDAIRALRPANPGLVGPFATYAEIPYGGVWDSPEWIEVSRSKLARIGEINASKAGYAYADLIVLLVNSMSGPVKVLDCGGGTGFIYYLIADRLKPGVEWVVSDSEALAEIGRSQAGNRPISFTSEPVQGVDVVYVNTSLQYAPDWRACVDSLLTHKPKHLILTRLLCAKTETLYFRQTVYGRSTPCGFVSRADLIAHCAAAGYSVAFDEPCWEESASMLAMLPPDTRQHFDAPSRNMVFSLCHCWQG